MNASTFGTYPGFGSLPASACDLGVQGADGPDRISYRTYDNADRLLSITAGYGTAAPRIEAAGSYTANGRQATVTDGKGNVTTYESDGFDRVVKVRYPNASGGDPRPATTSSTPMTPPGTSPRSGCATVGPSTTAMTPWVG